MKKHALVASVLLSLAALLAAVPPGARAAPGDTCYETPTVNIDCSDKQAPAKPAQKAPPRRAKIAKSADTQKADAIAKRITDAQNRVRSTLDNPAAPGAERNYKAAMADLHRAYEDAVAASPADKSFAADVRAYEAALTREGAQAGWGKAPGVPTERIAERSVPPQSGPAESPRGPDDLLAIGANVYVCDKAIAGNNVSCREISAGGSRCTSVILTDGAVAWRDSIEMKCDPTDLQKRAAFIASAADAKAGPWGEDFAMNHADTEAEIAKLNSPRCDLLVGNLVAAAKKEEGKAALAAYEALKQAGGCGALQYVKEEAPPAKASAGNDPRFVQRGATPNLDSTAGACDKDPQRCAELVNQLKEGTSGAAVAAMMSNAISVGLQLGGMMSQGLSLAQQPQIVGTANAAQRATTARSAAPSGNPVSALSCNIYGCSLSNGSRPNPGGGSTISGQIGR